MPKWLLSALDKLETHCNTLIRASQPGREPLGPIFRYGASEALGVTIDILVAGMSDLEGQHLEQIKNVVDRLQPEVQVAPSTNGLLSPIMQRYDELMVAATGGKA